MRWLGWDKVLDRRESGAGASAVAPPPAGLVAQSGGEQHCLKSSADANRCANPDRAPATSHNGLRGPLLSKPWRAAEVPLGALANARAPAAAGFAVHTMRVRWQPHQGRPAAAGSAPTLAAAAATVLLLACAARAQVPTQTPALSECASLRCLCWGACRLMLCRRLLVLTLAPCSSCCSHRGRRRWLHADAVKSRPCD